ncbi:MAG: type II toxin-antitoxin system VapC family toxin [Thaumarchaeota archaeon]|nr:type II toxin-antitoxin system VapC family toxin [Nitrososphaerota archaeon]
MEVVIDASAMKWYLKEEMRLLRSEILAGRVKAHVPSLVFIELANLLRYARGLSSGDVVNGVRAAMSIGLIVHDFEEVLERALSIAFERDLTVYDSIYAALAEALDASLITYDEKLLEKVDRSVKAGDMIRGFRDR